MSGVFFCIDRQSVPRSDSGVSSRNALTCKSDESDCVIPFRQVIHYKSNTVSTSTMCNICLPYLFTARRLIKVQLQSCTQEFWAVVLFISPGLQQISSILQGRLVEVWLQQSIYIEMGKKCVNDLHHREMRCFFNTIFHHLQPLLVIVGTNPLKPANSPG